MKIFIGSSREKIDIVDEISSIIEEFGVTPIPWNTPGLFLPGCYTANRLIEIAKNEVNAAILVFTPDDKIWYRGNAEIQSRDNVIFEHGLFSGVLDFEKAIIVKCGGDFKYPSDLAGMTYIDFDNKSRAKIELKKWLSSMKSTKTNNNIEELRKDINFENTDLKIFSRFQEDMRDSILDFVSEIYWDYDIENIKLDDYLTIVLTKFINQFIGINDARFTIRQYDKASNSMVTMKTTREDSIPGPIPLDKPNMISESAKRNKPLIFSENKEFHYTTKNKSISKGIYQDYVTYNLLKTEDDKPVFSICLDVKNYTAINRMKSLVHSLVFEIICNPIIEKFHLDIEQIQQN